jgi:hypothetical protein
MLLLTEKISGENQHPVKIWKLEYGPWDVKRADKIWNQPVPNILQISSHLPAFYLCTEHPLFLFFLNQGVETCGLKSRSRSPPTSAAARRGAGSCGAEHQDSLRSHSTATSFLYEAAVRRVPSVRHQQLTQSMEPLAAGVLAAPADRTCNLQASQPLYCTVRHQRLLGWVLPSSENPHPILRMKISFLILCFLQSVVPVALDL